MCGVSPADAFKGDISALVLHPVHYSQNIVGPDSLLGAYKAGEAEV